MTHESPVLLALLTSLFGAQLVAQGPTATPATARFHPDASRPAASVASGQDATSDVSLGDLDGDGDIDMVANGSPFGVHFQTSPGVFTWTPSTIQTNGFGRTILRDMDGDGDLDAVFAPTASFSTQLRFWENDGTGQLIQRPLPTNLQFLISQLEIADVDADGQQDLLVAIAASTGQPRLQIWRNQGGFAFLPAPTPLPVSTFTNYRPTFADIDGDGDFDIVASTISDRSILLVNDGAGTFTSGTLPTTRLGYLDTLSADFDGDGAFDVAQLWWNGDLDVTWGGATLQVQTGVANGYESFELADIDGDADLDMILVKPDGFDILRQLGGRQFAVESGVDNLEQVRFITPLDIDNDGKAELLVNQRDAPGALRVIYPDPLIVDIRLETGHAATTTTARHPLVAGDINGDSRIDLISFTSTAMEIDIAIGAGRYRRVTQQAPIAANIRQQSELVDLDRDGDLDLLLAAGPNMQAWSNDGTGSFTLSHSYIASSSAVSYLSLADLDADGDMDVIRSSVDTLQQFTNLGGGAFSLPLVHANGPFSVDARTSLGDIDGDGDIDCLTNLPGPNNSHSILINNGLGTLTLAQNSQAAIAGLAVDVSLGDLDGDGDLDIITAYSTNPALRFLRNDGSGRFQDAPIQPLNVRVSPALDLVDLDADADLDIYYSSLSGSTPPTLLINDGNGGFTDRSTDWANTGTANGDRHVFADFDGDGDIDILTGSPGVQDEPRLNHLRQLASATAPQLGGAIDIDIYSEPSSGTPGLSLLLAGFALRPAGPLAIPGIDGFYDLDIAASQTLAVLVHSPTGRDRVSLAIPTIPGLIGTEIYFQQLMLPSNNLASGFSNVVVERLLP